MELTEASDVRRTPSARTPVDHANNTNNSNKESAPRVPSDTYTILRPSTETINGTLCYPPGVNMSHTSNHRGTYFPWVGVRFFFVPCFMSGESSRLFFGMRVFAFSV